MSHIKTENLCVDFKIYGEQSQSLKRLFASQVTGGKIIRKSEDFSLIRALDDVNLEIKAGENVGLIGHNGSGKSTLLRILSGIYKPTAGHVHTEGKRATLLNSTAGMDPKQSGLTNIYLRSSILGMNKAEVDAKMDSILETAQLGEYINMPVEIYSAGMATRLAASIFLESRPNILLIDESFGAGDEKFQKRAKKKIDQMFEEVEILVLASHSKEMIKRFCNRTISFERGKIIADTPLTQD